MFFIELKYNKMLFKYINNYIYLIIIEYKLEILVTNIIIF